MQLTKVLQGVLISSHILMHNARMQATLVALNERGLRIGATHHNAKVPDEIVNQIRDLHEDHGIGYRRLARMFNLKRAFIQKVCTYRIRAQVPASWKRITNAA